MENKTMYKNHINKTVLFVIITVIVAAALVFIINAYRNNPAESEDNLLQENISTDVIPVIQNNDADKLVPTAVSINKPVILSYSFPTQNGNWRNKREMSTPNIIDVPAGIAITRNEIIDCYKQNSKLLKRVSLNKLIIKNYEYDSLKKYFIDIISDSIFDGITIDELDVINIFSKENTENGSRIYYKYFTDILNYLRTRFPEKIICVYGAQDDLGKKSLDEKWIMLLLKSVERNADIFFYELYLSEKVDFDKGMKILSNRLEQLPPKLLNKTIILLGKYPNIIIPGNDHAAHLKKQLEYYFNHTNTHIRQAAGRGIGIYATQYLYYTDKKGNIVNEMPKLDTVISNYYLNGKIPETDCYH